MIAVARQMCPATILANTYRGIILNLKIIGLGLATALAFFSTPASATADGEVATDVSYKCDAHSCTTTTVYYRWDAATGQWVPYKVITEVDYDKNNRQK